VWRAQEWWHCSARAECELPGVGLDVGIDVRLANQAGIVAAPACNEPNELRDACTARGLEGVSQPSPCMHSWPPLARSPPFPGLT
jgi:hypothetical protein